jgi:ABC-type multidrug transport system ATPase subunit
MGLKVEKLYKSFGALQVIRDFSYAFPERGSIAITGRSGCGKTTLLHMLLGILKPDSGVITGAPRMGAVFQEDRLVNSLSVKNNLRLITKDADEIARHLRAVGLYDNRGDRITELSGGMKRRLAIARAVLYKCDAMLMDEPYVGLDMDTRARVAEYALSECADRLIIFITHDPEVISLMKPADIITLEGGTHDNREVSEQDRH